MQTTGDDADNASDNNAATYVDAATQTTGNNADDENTAVAINATTQTMHDGLQRRQHRREADKADDG